MLVKLPGPRPTTIRSISAGSPTSSLTASSTSPARARRAVSPRLVPQTAPKDVAVSKAKVVITRDPDPAVGLVDVAEGNRHPSPREPVAAVLGPFHEGDGAVEVGLEVTPLFGIEAGDAVQVEVRDGRRGVVSVADRERGAGDGLDDAERPGGAADEGRLPRAELAGDGDH